MHVKVKDLPAPVQTALASVRYGRADISVVVSETVTLGSMGAGDGFRSFAVLVNLTTGEHVTRVGSWGGVNMFDRANVVDNDTRAYTLPRDGVAITGSMGGGKPTYAVLNIPASMTDRMLPAPPEELTKAERDTLYCFRSIKGGDYRRRELENRGVTPANVDAMVSRGFLKRNRAGATAITTEGRNALGEYRGY